MPHTRHNPLESTQPESLAHSPHLRDQTPNTTASSGFLPLWDRRRAADPRLNHSSRRLPQPTHRRRQPWAFGNARWRPWGMFHRVLALEPCSCAACCPSPLLPCACWAGAAATPARSTSTAIRTAQIPTWKGARNRPLPVLAARVLFLLMVGLKLWQLQARLRRVQLRQRLERCWSL